MKPADARRQLMTDFGASIQRAMSETVDEGLDKSAVLLLDLRDERAQQLAARVADLTILRDIVADAECTQSAPILVACASNEQAAALMRGRSRMSKLRFATNLPPSRFHMVVVSSGGITWAVGTHAGDGTKGSAG